MKNSRSRFFHHYSLIGVFVAFLMSSFQASALSFDVIEATTNYVANANGQRLYTKVTDDATSPVFLVKVVAQTTTNGSLDDTINRDIKVQLFDVTIATNNSCIDTAAVALSGEINVTLTKGISSVINIPKSSVNPSLQARYRITDGSTKYCSSDKFAIRPAFFDLRDNTVGTTATCEFGDPENGKDPTKRATYTYNGETKNSHCYAGVPFRIYARPAGGNGIGYVDPSNGNTANVSVPTHTPLINTKNISWGTAPVGTLSFTPQSGSAFIPYGTNASFYNDNFYYSEVGYFQINEGAVTDATFTADSGDFSGGDCIQNSASNSPDKDGKVGCTISSQTSKYFGRFLPHHYTAKLTGGFGNSGTILGTADIRNVYSGQPLKLTIDVANASGERPKNYTGDFAKKLSVAPYMARTTDANRKNDSERLDVPLNNLGTLSISFPNKTKMEEILDSDISNGPVSGLVEYTPGNTPPNTPPPWNSSNASETYLPFVQVTDPDGVSALNFGWPGASNAVNSFAYADLISPYVARASLKKVTGVFTQNLSMPFFIEYWDGEKWVKQTSEQINKTGDTSIFSDNAVSLSLALTPATLRTCVLDDGIGVGVSGAGCSTRAPIEKSFKKGGSLTAGDNTFTGDFNLWLKAPLTAGKLTVTAKVPKWLAEKSTVSATATFVGKARSVTYMREIY